MAKSSCIQNGCLGGIALLCLLTIGFSSFVLVSLKAKDSEMTHKAIHLVLDAKQIRDCPGPRPRLTKPSSFNLPCFESPNECVNDEGGLRPLICKDDFFDEEGGTNSCESSRDTFHLNSDRNAVVLQKAGIYRIYGQVTFKDKNAAPVAVMLCINDHSFIQCHQQNVQPVKPQSAPYATCTLNGERRLRSGDKVTLFLPEQHRTVNSFHKTTFWGMVRVAD